MSKVYIANQDNLINPNLLDNWYFGNPVNQRGLNKYNTPGYTIDRWKTTNNVSCITVKDDCINLSSPGNENTTRGYVRHFFEKPLHGIYTFSILAKGTGTIFGDFITVNGNFDSVKHYNVNNNYQLFSWTFDTNNFANGGVDDSGIIQFYLAVYPGSSIDILAAKVELGDKQTLAHQDTNGNWILNEIPNYADQLLRCQRYYMKFDEICGYGWTNNGGGFTTVYLPVPVVMRANPKITANLIAVISQGKSPDRINNIDIIGTVHGNQIYFNHALNGLLTQMYPTIITLTNVIFDADL